MPLSELPSYIDSVRMSGQSDVPVVDMGRIVDDRSGVFGRRAAGILLCLFLMAGGVLYGMGSTRRITIASDMDPSQIADLVAGEGVRVVSVKKEDEDKYEVRVFAPRGFGSFLERLRSNKQLDSVELSE